jgi:geranylgeranyl reductase
MQIVIAGGGPAGASCAKVLAKAGIRAIMIEASPDGDKPCAGGLPSILLERYQIPDLLIKKKATGVVFEAPSGYRVNTDFPKGQFIATVNRKEFDSHLRWLAEDAGAISVRGRVVSYDSKGSQILVRYNDIDGVVRTTEADFVVGADGAWSRIAYQAMGDHLPMVVALQEIISPKADRMAELGNRCIFNYNPAVSPDYYGWIFPKGNSVSVGVGTHMDNKQNLEDNLKRMKELHADLLDGGETVTRNGALIPVGRYPEYGKDRIVLTGDAAGFVLPACGEGIYYAMRSGEIAANVIKDLGPKRPDIVVSKYTDLINAEFNPIFRYFKKIEKIALSSPINREVLVRLADDKFMSRKILNAFSTKERYDTPFFKKVAVFFHLIGLRTYVAMKVANQPGFGE